MDQLLRKWVLLAHVVRRMMLTKSTVVVELHEAQVHGQTIIITRHREFNYHQSLPNTIQCLALEIAEVIPHATTILA